MYPRLEINLAKLKHNAKAILDLCHKNNINCFFVTKALAGNKKCVKSIYDLGFTHIADSRIDNLKKFHSLKIPKVLLRLPMMSEISKVIKYCDISLNSEVNTIKALNKYAAKYKKAHRIILMFDLGDLREGIFYKDDYIKIVENILKLSNIKIIGIGTNLTCYGGVIPNYYNLSELTNIKRKIENTFKIKLKIISGGNSSSLYLLDNKEIPKEVNNLRIGEALLLGRETAFGNKMNDMYQDVFILKGQIIECIDKPSFPIGDLGVDSFGQKPVFKDKGIIKRGIVAIGKQDIIFDNLYPLDKNIEIIGGSSDHLIVDLSNTHYQLGDILSFNVNYPGLLQSMTSPYIKKQYKD